MEYEDNIYDPNTPLLGVADEEDDTYETTQPFAPSEYGGLPSNMGTQALNYMNLGLQAGVRSLQEKYAAAEERLRQKIEGGESKGARMERLLTLAAALGRPTKTGSFGEELSNFTEAYAQTVGAQRQRREALEDKLAELQAAKAASLGDLQSKYFTQLGSVASKSIRPMLPKTVGIQEIGGKKVVVEQDPNAPGGYRKVELGEATPEVEQVNNVTAGGIPVFRDKRTGALSIMGGQPIDVSQLDPIRTELSPQSRQQLIQNTSLAASLKSSLDATNQALKLNEQAYSGKFKGLNVGLEELVGGKSSPEYLATVAMDNLLTKGAIAKMRETFGSQFTKAEGDLLIALEGAGTLTRDARRELLQRAIPVLQNAMQRIEKENAAIKGGFYDFMQSRPRVAPSPAPSTTKDGKVTYSGW